MNGRKITVNQSDMEIKTDFEKLSIKNMLRKGMSNKEIAKEIHRTYEATKHITKTVFC